jgi:hypothetical protein
MKKSVFVEATGKLECAITALQVLRVEYRNRRITPEQKARVGNLLGALAKEIEAADKLFGAL